MEGPLLGTGPPPFGAERHQDPAGAQLGQPQPADQHLGVARPARQVAGEVERDHARHVVHALVGDAERGADRAPAVAAQQVAGADAQGGAGGVVGDLGGHAVGVLRAGGQLVVEADHARRELLGARPQAGFEAVLRQVGLPLRAGRLPLGGTAARAPGLDARDAAAVVRAVAGKAHVPAGIGHLFGRGAGRVHGVGQPDVAQDLHGPLVQHVGLGQHGRRREGAHQQRGDAHAAEEQGGGEAGGAAAGDEDRHIGLVRHWALRESQRSEWVVELMSQRRSM